MAANGEMQTVVSTYLQQVGIPSVTGALQNFWAAKLADGPYPHRRVSSDTRNPPSTQLGGNSGNYATPQLVSGQQHYVTVQGYGNGNYGDGNGNGNGNGQSAKRLAERGDYDDALITYETEHVNVGAEQRYIAYVTLPGGACFGSHESKRSGAEARKAAGTIALYNSLANEHPYRIVTQTFVTHSLAMATQQPLGGSLDSVDTYRLVLERNLGRSMLELQEFMCAFRLLSWAGIIARLRVAGFSQQRLIAEYAECLLDDTFRSNLCLAWMSRLERDRDAGIKLYSEFLKCESELHDARHKVTELRFEKEKRDIIRLAYSQFNQDLIARNRMLYAANFAIV